MAGVMSSTNGVLSRWLHLVPATTDVVWLVVALFVKQTRAVDSMSWYLKPGGVWMSVSVAAFFGLLVVTLPQRGRPWFSLGVNVGLSFMLFGDVIYVRYFSDMPSFALLNASHQTMGKMLPKSYFHSKIRV